MNHFYRIELILKFRLSTHLLFTVAFINDSIVFKKQFTV